MISASTKEKIREELVLTKLSDSYCVKKFDDEYFVLVRDIAIPYRIFILVLLIENLWSINCSKLDWIKVNRELFMLWIELDILPEGVDFRDNISRRHKTRAPISTVEKLIKNIELEEEQLLYFHESCGTIWAKPEALLYLIEQQYQALANQ